MISPGVPIYIAGNTANEKNNTLSNDSMINTIEIMITQELQQAKQKISSEIINDDEFASQQHKFRNQFQSARYNNMRSETWINTKAMSKETFISELNTLNIDHKNINSQNIKNPYMGVTFLLDYLGYKGVDNKNLTIQDNSSFSRILPDQQNLYIALMKYQNDKDSSYNKFDKDMSDDGLADGAVGGLTLRGLIQDAKIKSEKTTEVTTTEVKSKVYKDEENDNISIPIRNTKIIGNPLINTPTILQPVSIPIFITKNSTQGVGPIQGQNLMIEEEEKLFNFPSIKKQEESPIEEVSLGERSFSISDSKETSKNIYYTDDAYIETKKRSVDIQLKNPMPESVYTNCKKLKFTNISPTGVDIDFVNSKDYDTFLSFLEYFDGKDGTMYHAYDNILQNLKQKNSITDLKSFEYTKLQNSSSKVCIYASFKEGFGSAELGSMGITHVRIPKIENGTYQEKSIGYIKENQIYKKGKLKKI